MRGHFEMGFLSDTLLFNQFRQKVAKTYTRGSAEKGDVRDG